MGKLYGYYLFIYTKAAIGLQVTETGILSSRRYLTAALALRDRQSGKLLTRIEFYAELKRMTAKIKTDPNTVTFKALITSNPIEAIKALREVSVLGLKEAKDVVDFLRSGVHQTVRLTDIAASRSLSAVGFKF